MKKVIPILENLQPYLESPIFQFIFVYLLQNKKLDNQQLREQLKALPTSINNEKIMTLYDELILEGVEKGIEKGIEKTILNAFDNNINLDTIRIITGETTEKINAILHKNNRI